MQKCAVHRVAVHQSSVDSLTTPRFAPGGPRRGALWSAHGGSALAETASDGAMVNKNGSMGRCALRREPAQRAVGVRLGPASPHGAVARNLKSLKKTMTSSLSPAPVVLIAGASTRSVSAALEDFGQVVVRAPNAKLTLDFARAMKPDAILVDHDGLDVPSIDFCYQLRRDVEIDPDVPVLLMLAAAPAPETRVAGLRAGVWDYLRSSDSPEEIALKIEMHVHAKRNVQAAAVDGLVNRASGVLTRTGFTQRLRELGALMVRMRGGLSCVVFVFSGGPQDGTEATLIAGASRTSDVVGALSRTEIAVATPATGAAGAVVFATRMASVLREATRSHPVLANTSLQAGYASIDNLKYSPINPIRLLGDSIRAVTVGAADVQHPWIRRSADSESLSAASPYPGWQRRSSPASGIPAAETSND